MESNLHDGFDWTESLAETWTYIVAAKTQAVCGRVLSCNVTNNRHCKEGEYNMWEPTQNGIEVSHSRCFQPMLVVTTFPSTFVETIFALPMLVVVNLDMFLFVKNLKWYGAGQQCGCSEMIGRAWNYSNHLREVRISLPATVGPIHSRQITDYTEWKGWVGSNKYTTYVCQVYWNTN